MERELKRVDTVARVRRAFHAQGWSKKRISRELHVSCSTVRKILRSGETNFAYERGHQPLPKIGPWVEPVDRLLRANEGKAARERLTLIRIYEEVRALGYEGSYDAVRCYAKTWAKARGSATANAYVPLCYAPGEAYQFDWSHEIVLINGVTVTVKVAHVRLCHSRMMFARAYMRESQEPRHRARTDGAPMARCSMPMTGRLLSFVAPARGASTTT
jgi:transcriptional regulator with XRE-family HTH domain